ncbi:hypothetical protein MFLAVUS_002510 [Mucor flavus]|uniref:Uncharacterized protein n=1 Tax=Mucor flavus TaxID=439312 RepID=A0ABP9YQH4_9FUNG
MRTYTPKYTHLNNKRQLDDRNEVTESRSNKKERPKEKSINNISVIRIGKGLSPKPDLDIDIYNRRINIRKTSVHNNLTEFNNNVKGIPAVDGKEEIVFSFLEDIFRRCHSDYSSKQNLEDGEATYKDSLIYPFLKSVAKKPLKQLGEAALKAMITQIDDTSDESNLCKADRLIKLYEMKELEMLLLKTSSYFGSTDKSKSCFDHHKDFLGLCRC